MRGSAVSPPQNFDSSADNFTGFAKPPPPPEPLAFLALGFFGLLGPVETVPGLPSAPMKCGPRNLFMVNMVTES